MAEAARRAAPQPLLRRRRRPVDLFLARRRGRQHPPLREGLPRREDHPARAELPLDQPHPRRRRRPHRPQRRPPRQDLVDRRRRRREGPRHRRLGRPRGSAPRRRGHREPAARSGLSLDDIAILVRAQFQTREFEERFIAIGLPYQIIGGFRFYERAEIRDAIAYLRLIQSPADDLAFERIVNSPSAASATRRSPPSTSTRAPAPGAAADRRRAPARQRRADPAGPPLARPFRRRHRAAGARWPTRLPHPELARIVLEESGYTAMLQADRSAEAAGRLENLAELTRAMEEYESLGAFLEHVSLVMDNDEARSGEKVTIMTIHAAKGLEFDTVFLPGWEEGVFPSQRSLDEGGLASLEEERRLAYVAITRARRRATIIHAANRRIYGQWTSSHPQPLPRRAAQGAYRGRNDDDRRREPVARAMVASAPIPSPISAPPSRCAPAPAAPAGSARAAATSTPSRSGSIEARASRGQPRQPGPHRPRARPARVPRQVRLRHDRRDRRQQARDRVRESRPEEGAR